VALLQTFTSIPIAAWGDLDAHGIRIIGDLISRVGRHVYPVAMDVAAYVNGKKYFQDEKKRAENMALAKDLAASTPVELRQLAKAIVETMAMGASRKRRTNICRQGSRHV
jgi:hypothetical protein